MLPAPSGLQWGSAVPEGFCSLLPGAAGAGRRGSPAQVSYLKAKEGSARVTPRMKAISHCPAGHLQPKYQSERWARTGRTAAHSPADNHRDQAGLILQHLSVHVSKGHFPAGLQGKEARKGREAGFYYGSTCLTHCLAPRPSLALISFSDSLWIWPLGVAVSRAF